MRDHVANSVQSLTTLLKNMDELEAVSGELSEVSAKLLAAKDEYAKINEALKTGRGLLTAAQEKAAKDHDAAIWEKTIQLRETGEQLQSLIDQREMLMVEVRNIRGEHDAVLQSMGVLRSRLQVGGA